MSLWGVWGVWGGVVSEAPLIVCYTVMESCSLIIYNIISHNVIRPIPKLRVPNFRVVGSSFWEKPTCPASYCKNGVEEAVGSSLLNPRFLAWGYGRAVPVPDPQDVHLRPSGGQPVRAASLRGPGPDGRVLLPGTVALAAPSHPRIPHAASCQKPDLEKRAQPPGSFELLRG